MNKCEWISQSKAMGLLAIGPRAWARLLDSGILTVRHVPGSHLRVLRAQIEDLARQHTREGSRPKPQFADAAL